MNRKRCANWASSTPPWGADAVRILMIAPEPVFEPRGTPLSVVGRLKAYSDMGHSVDLLTYSIGRDVGLPNVRIHRIPKVPGIRRIKIGPSIRKLPLDFLLMVKSAVWASTRRFDLIHTHEEAGLWGAALGRWLGIPHLYDMHSSLPQQLGNFQFTRSSALVRLFEAVEAWILKHSSAVITICPDLQAHVEKRLPSARGTLIENVVDYGMVFGESDRSAAILKSLGLAGKKVVLYTGTFEPYQGLRLLIGCGRAVLDAVPSARFLLVGGHPDQLEAYRKEVREKGLEPFFIFTGQIPPEDVNSYIRCADTLVSPRTRGTNTPLKIYAYLRSGVPIVATRLWTHTQVLDDGVSILTEPDAESFGRGIVRALTDKRRARSVGRGARRMASERYGYRTYLDRLEAVLSAAAGKEE
jgi:glycosyltransferase involved in cell wall biosynthesis